MYVDSAVAVRPQPDEQEARKSVFNFKLELADGTPANPPTFGAAVPDWGPGETTPPGHEQLRVIERREGRRLARGVLVVEHDQNPMRGVT